MTDDYGVQSVPPRNDEYNSYYVHNSEGYKKAVEEIDAGKREEAVAETRDRNNRIQEEQYSQRIYENNREEEKRVQKKIDAGKREEIDAENRNSEKRIQEERDRRRIEEYNREQERLILEEISLKEEEVEAQNADLSEYEERDNSPPPGTNVDLLA